MQGKAVSIVVAGRVQGVGFRYFATRKASELQISGWVRNTLRGTVEIEAEGEAARIDTFCDWIRMGPPRAAITSCLVTEIPRSGYKTFVVR
jgi:acylphosphatase